VRSSAGVSLVAGGVAGSARGALEHAVPSTKSTQRRRAVRIDMCASRPRRRKARRMSHGIVSAHEVRWARATLSDRQQPSTRQMSPTMHISPGGTARATRATCASRPDAMCPGRRTSPSRCTRPSSCTRARAWAQVRHRARSRPVEVLPRRGGGGGPPSMRGPASPVIDASSGIAASGIAASGIRPHVHVEAFGADVTRLVRPAVPAHGTRGSHPAPVGAVAERRGAPCAHPHDSKHCHRGRGSQRGGRVETREPYVATRVSPSRPRARRPLSQGLSRSTSVTTSSSHMHDA